MGEVDRPKIEGYNKHICESISEIDRLFFAVFFLLRQIVERFREKRMEFEYGL